MEPTAVASIVPEGRQKPDRGREAPCLSLPAPAPNEAKGDRAQAKNGH